MSISRRGVVFGAVLLSVTVSGCMVGALDVDFGDHGLAEIRVIVETTPVDVRVRTDQPVDGSRRDYIVDYEITVPADFAVTGVNRQRRRLSARSAGRCGLPGRQWKGDCRGMSPSPFGSPWATAFSTPPWFFRMTGTSCSLSGTAPQPGV
jgi:hypothetical protein